MSYYIYRISPHRALTYVEAFEEYKQARQLARQMRRDQSAGDSDDIRMVFAKDRTEAESLLRTRRERQPSEDD